jgi:hypothetical protein
MKFAVIITLLNNMLEGADPSTEKKNTSSAFNEVLNCTTNTSFVVALVLN